MATEKISLDYMRLVRYVDAACNLAESVTADIKGSKSPKISNETVINLSKFYAASQAVQKLLDMVEKDKVQVN